MIKKLGIDKYNALYLWAVFMIVFGIMKHDAFLSSASFKLVTQENVLRGVIGLAFLVPLVTGTFDLSVGAMCSMSLVISARLSKGGLSWGWVPERLQHPWPGGWAVLFALCCCALAGFLSGFVVVKLRVNSFIATLGMSEVMTAFIIKTSKQSITTAFSDSWRNVGKAEFLGLARYVWYFLILAAIVWYVFEHTPLGRYMFATGGNPEAARLTGVRTDRLVWGSLVASAVIAGFAGTIYGWKIGNYADTVGPGYLFAAIAAVFFGASQIKGRPNVWGMLIALYALAWGIKGLQLTVQDANWLEHLFYGVSLLGAVSLASRQGIIKVPKRKKPADGSTVEPAGAAPAG